MTRIVPALTLIALTAGALAADYKLSVDASPDQLAKAKSLRVYGFKFGKDDRIMAVSAGKAASGNLRITFDGSGNATALPGEHQGYGGKLLAAPGMSPAKSFAASLEPFVPTTAKAPDFKEKAQGFVETPLGMATIASLFLLAGGAFMLMRKPRSGHREPSLPNRRKSIDESLKEIVKRLDLVDENQRNLVKKPPMLRSFKAQIDLFDSRLKKLETQLDSIQGISARNAESLGSLGRGHKDLTAKAEGHDAALATSQQAVTDLRAALLQLGKEQAARSDESLSHQGKQALELQNRLAALEKASAEQHAKTLADLDRRVTELAASLPQPKDYDQALANLAKQLQELPKPKDYDAALEALAKQFETLPQPKNYDPALEALAKRIDDLPKPKNYDEALQALDKRFDGLKDYDEALSHLAKQIEELPAPKDYDGALAGLSKQVSESAKNLPQPKNYDEALAGLEARLSGICEAVEKSQPKDYDQELRQLSAAAQESKAAIEAVAGELRATLDFPSGEDFGELAAQQRQHAGLLQSLATRLEELQSGLEARIGEIGARSDQRDELLLSLQSRVSDSDGKPAEGAELLPVISGLRLELQALAQAVAAIDAKTQALGDDLSNLPQPAPQDDSALKALAAEQAKLSEALAALHARPDDSALVALAAEQAKLADALAGLTRPQEDTKFQEALLALSKDLQSWKDLAPTSVESHRDDSKLAGALEALAQDLEKWKTQADEAQKHIDERLANESMILETLSSALLQWRADGDANRAALEERLNARLESLAHRPEPAAAAPAAVSSAPVHEEDLEQRAEPIVIEFTAPAEPAKEAAAEAEPVIEEEAPAQGGWRMLGASQSRRWSSPMECPISVKASTQNLTALTPTITASTEFRVGPVLYFGKKAIYAHGPNLCGAWPGKPTSTVALQEQLPADPWRLAAHDGHAFCVEEDQVEIVSLSAWRVVARFSGTYVDQVCTDNHWVGLASSMGKLFLDFRNVQGRLLGTQIPLSLNADDYAAVAAEGERLYVAAQDGRIFRVELGEVHDFAAAEKGLQLLTISTQKNGLVVTVRKDGKDSVRLYGLDGMLQKQLALGFSQGFDHPVHIADKLYVVDGDARKLVTVNLKKMELAGSFDLPGEKVGSFCGVYRGDQHALIATVGDKEHSRLLVLDPKSGASQAICDVTEPTIFVLAADSKLVVATSCFYQNMVRVFDPFKANQAAQAA